MKLWHKIAQDQRLIGVLVLTNVAQFVVILGLILTLVTIPTRFTFHIPPDLSNGATLHANHIPKNYVGQFAFYIWQVLNNWPTNGTQDAPKNLKAYGAYLSPTFAYALAQTDAHLKSLGELSNRIRVIRPGSDSEVTQLSDHTWQVILVVRDSEYVNGVLVKDKTIRYPLRVIGYNGNAQRNPFGLVLDGFINTPKILKVMK